MIPYKEMVITIQTLLFYIWLKLVFFGRSFGPKIAGHQSVSTWTIISNNINSVFWPEFAYVGGGGGGSSVFTSALISIITTNLGQNMTIIKNTKTILHARYWPGEQMGNYWRLSLEINSSKQ